MSEHEDDVPGADDSDALDALDRLRQQLEDADTRADALSIELEASKKDYTVMQVRFNRVVDKLFRVEAQLVEAKAKRKKKKKKDKSK